MDFSVTEEKKQITGACLKVIGVGGGGGNAVNSMAACSEMSMVTFIIANTDAQALDVSPVVHKVQLGEKITKGLGAGSNPEIGRRAAEEDLDVVIELIKGADILFLTGGMGGGTGSGALPVIATAARELGILTVGVVTKPFTFEGRRRMAHADDAIRHLKQSVDTLLVVPNQKLLESVDPKISMLDAFALSNNVLKQAIKGISDIITKPGHINVDFADVRSIMKDMGLAIMGIGRKSGEGRAREAAIQAITSPLLEEVSIQGARGVLINVTGNLNLGLHEINDAAEVIYDLVSEDANIILGSVIDESLGDEIMVTVIATGFEQADRPVDYGIHRNAGAGYNSYHAPRQQTPSRSPSVSTAPHVQAARPEPTVQVKQAPRPERLEEVGGSLDMQDLDTPTFLRRKMLEKEEERRS
ncbi:MAG: cell division protein FtsZ [Candidatus Dependentiae bacterium]|nr:cell division protein FtsZ [Candidatus Dependentiae bacterium]